MGNNIDLSRYRTFVRDAEKLYKANPNETQAAVLQSAKALLAEKEKEAGPSQSSFEGKPNAQGRLNALVIKGGSTILFEADSVLPTVDRNEVKCNAAGFGINGLLDKNAASKCRAKLQGQ